VQNAVTANDVAVITGRARTIESMHLNQLYRGGIFFKEKKARKAIFIVKEEYRERQYT